MSAIRHGLPGAWIAIAGMYLVSVPQLLYSSQPKEDQVLDEITVQGMPIHRMRRELVALEERFFALYNQLNTDKDFHVNCDREAPTGTLIERRVCRAAYLEKAQADWGQAFVAGLRNADPMPGFDSTAPESVELDRWTEFRANALRVINGDQQLLRLARERVELERRYVAELKRRHRE